jgi:DnaK suppressor protein
MASASKLTRNRFHGVEKELFARRQKLMDGFARQRAELFEPPDQDDECADATLNSARDVILATLDRERRTLAEIESAIERLKSGDYGTCRVCDARISDARLRALPWARLCLSCAERSPSI